MLAYAYLWIQRVQAWLMSIKQHASANGKWTLCRIHSYMLTLSFLTISINITQQCQQQMLLLQLSFKQSIIAVPNRSTHNIYAYDNVHLCWTLLLTKLPKIVYTSLDSLGHSMIITSIKVAANVTQPISLANLPQEHSAESVTLNFLLIAVLKFEDQDRNYTNA